MNQKAMKNERPIWIKHIEIINRLNFSWWQETPLGIGDNRRYYVEYKNNHYKCRVDTALPSLTSEKTMDDSRVNKLLQLLEECNVVDWDGYNEADQELLLSGISWSLKIKANNGNISVKAQGFCRFPKKYEDFRQGIASIIEGLYTPKELEFIPF